MLSTGLARSIQQSREVVAFFQKKKSRELQQGCLYFDLSLASYIHFSYCHEEGEKKKKQKGKRNKKENASKKASMKLISLLTRGPQLTGASGFQFVKFFFRKAVERPGALWP